MQEIMFDIETFDISETAVVFQIGLVLFEADEEIEAALIELPVQEQIDMRRSISADTLRFWLDPQISYIAFKTLSSDTMSIGSVEASLRSFLEIATQAKRFWTKSFFDFKIMENILADYGLEPSWHNGQRRDLLTLMKECNVEKPNEGNSHNALYDALQQFEQLKRCRAVRWS